MINVVDSIRVKSGKLSDYLAILKANMHAVRKEKGCIEYVPAIDLDAELPPQVLDKDCVSFLRNGRAWMRSMPISARPICRLTGKR